MSALRVWVDCIYHAPVLSHGQTLRILYLICFHYCQMCWRADRCFLSPQLETAHWNDFFSCAEAEEICWGTGFTRGRVKNFLQILDRVELQIKGITCKRCAGEIPRPYNSLTWAAIFVIPSMDSMKPPSDKLFSDSDPGTALCVIRSIHKSFASCRCCHKSSVGAASATGCLTNVPQ